MSRVTCLTVTCDAAAAVSPYRLVVLVPAWQVQALVTPGARTTLHTCPGGRKYFLGLEYIFITHGGATNSTAFPTALHCLSVVLSDRDLFLYLVSIYLLIINIKIMWTSR